MCGDDETAGGRYVVATVHVVHASMQLQWSHRVRALLHIGVLHTAPGVMNNNEGA
ncbi:hypothetical protein CCHOA_11230 [Corynebacterium choanae]|uniref:Uncharacterized protein n=1 Tax=Corynebacterium choanae TaxID=1862358 RepID=A0A3G6J926_9CORY|nr:hypothetical protein CCHOA_11230 [Corynebacterium choanae]